MNTFEVYVPTLPPTTNMSYKSGKGRFYKTTESKNWQKQAALPIGAAHNRNPHNWTGKLLACSLFFFDNSVLTCDIDGRIKPILDCVAAKLEFDDRYIVKFDNLEQLKGPPGVLIRIRELTEQEIAETEIKYKGLLG